MLIEYFYRNDCMECREISELVLPQLSDACSDEYELKKYDLADDANFELMLSLLSTLNDDSNEKMYIFLNRTKILGGKKKIYSDLIPCVRGLYNSTAPAVTDILSPPPREEMSSRIRTGTVMLAGLLDGINPCVFATLIFFMSLLITAKISKNKLIVIGLVYTGGCFITYLAIGFGLFKLLGFGMGFAGLRTVVNLFMTFFLLLLSLFSFRDAWVFHRTGEAHKVSLQLPEKIKLRIHSLMRQSKNSKFLIPSFFLLGILVTLLESVCTGQVYLPTLMLLIKNDGVISEWFAYLLLYNVMFILPLLGVFMLTLGGISLARLLKLGAGHLVVSKILLGILFLLLAGLLFYSSGLNLFDRFSV